MGQCRKMGDPLKMPFFNGFWATILGNMIGRPPLCPVARTRFRRVLKRGPGDLMRSRLWGKLGI